MVHYQPMAAPTDAALVHAARDGDRTAFATLIERHYSLLLASCRRALGDSGAAADAAQEAVVHALLGLDRLRRPESFGPWLVGIGLNAARRALERPGRYALSLETLLGGLSEPAAGEPGPAELAEASLAAHRVRAAIAALPAGQRDAVALFYLAGLSAPEVAEQLTSTHGAVKTRLHKARATLRERLSDLREEPEKMTQSVRMRIADVRDTGAGGMRDSRVVLLQEEDGERRLPIWIGAPEGAALALRLADVELPRPGTYQLADELLRAAGATLSEVRIVALTDMVFYAQVVLADGATVDARPSDALNLALLAGVPIQVEPQVLAEADRTAARTREELEAALASPRDARALADEVLARLDEQRRRMEQLRS
jgi:RNA polymerase sigma factor (sigma-70 family)